MKITLGVMITLLVMVGCLIGIIICAKKQKTNPNASILAIVLMVVLVISCIFFMKKQDLFGSGEVKQLIKNENIYASSAATILGKFLSEKVADTKVLIITEVNFDKNPRQQMLIETIKSGLGAKFSDVAVEPFTTVDPATMGGPGVPGAPGVPPEGGAGTDAPPGGPGMMMPFGMIEPKAEDIDALIERYPDRKLVICLVMARNVEDMKVWTAEEEARPKLALLNCDVYKMKNAILSGIVQAAVTYNPSAVFSEKSAPSDTKKAFDERYVLLTPDNVEEIAEKFPNMFEKTE